MGCCFSSAKNKNEDEKHFGYKSLTFEMNKSKTVEKYKEPKLFQIKIPNQKKVSFNFKDKKLTKSTRKELLKESFMPTIYYIKMKNNSSKIAKYSSNIRSLNKDDKKCCSFCNCSNCLNKSPKKCLACQLILDRKIKRYGKVNPQYKIPNIANVTRLVRFQ